MNAEDKPKSKAGVKRSLAYFTDARVSMMLECNRHPVLKAQLLELEGDKDTNWSEWLAEIADYCNDTRMSYTTGIIIGAATGRLDS